MESVAPAMNGTLMRALNGMQTWLMAAREG